MTTDGFTPHHGALRADRAKRYVAQDVQSREGEVASRLRPVWGDRLHEKSIKHRPVILHIISCFAYGYKAKVST